jgi:hypothetical protein
MAESKLGRKYSWKQSLPDHRDHIYSAPHSIITSLPPIVDLRPHMPKIYDQQDLGACTSFGIGACMEYCRMKEGMPAIVPSFLFLYYNERVIENSIDSDCGAQIKTGIKSVTINGICDDNLWPYVNLHTNFKVKPPTNCYQAALKEKALTYSSIPQNLIQMKSALFSNFPIVFGATLFESFESDEVAKTGIVPYPNLSSSCLGGHCMTICGYSDNNIITSSGKVVNQVFIVRNSWGESFADKGYMYIPYSYLTNSQLASDMWKISYVSK